MLNRYIDWEFVNLANLLVHDMKTSPPGIILPLQWIYLFIAFNSLGQNSEKTNVVPIADGYAKSHVNATIFRKNSISTYKNHQCVAFYHNDANVMLAKRKLGSTSWVIKKTPYKGNVKDAHNVICIMHDSNGFLHMAWDHHGHPLRYAVSLEPESIEMGEKRSMTGESEEKVTYPEFYKLTNGDLLFVYRDGSSGNGNLVMNRYEIKSRRWVRVQGNLIDGEGERNAYWQMCTDQAGTIHLSWVWRETGDVATNHDMCYARSRDHGKSWETSTGRSYQMPINAQNAEYILRIPQQSNLINQTSMTTDHRGNPYIATYFKGATDSSTQFKVIYRHQNKWKVSTVSNRRSNFELRGRGSKSIPISRPQIIAENHNQEPKLHLISRDEEFGNRVCLASAKIGPVMNWKIKTLNDISMRRWEPSYDTELWKNHQLFHIYLQVTEQGDGETTIDSEPTKVNVMEVSLD